VQAYKRPTAKFVDTAFLRRGLYLIVHYFVSFVSMLTLLSWLCSRLQDLAILLKGFRPQLCRVRVSLVI